MAEYIRGKNMLKALVDITEEMVEAHKCCSEDSDCNECPCHIGNDDCVYNYVVEVKRGHWIEDEVCVYACSECGFTFTSADDISEFKYCRCGAKMDGKE